MRKQTKYPRMFLWWIIEAANVRITADYAAIIVEKYVKCRRESRLEKRKWSHE